MQTLTYQNVDSVQWNNIKSTLANNGVTITNDSGEISSHGVEARYSYSGSTLTVTVDRAPFLFGVGHVASILDSKIKETLNG